MGGKRIKKVRPNGMIDREAETEDGSGAEPGKQGVAEVIAEQGTIRDRADGGGVSSGKEASQR